MLNSVNDEPADALEEAFSTLASTHTHTKVTPGVHQAAPRKKRFLILLCASASFIRNGIGARVRYHHTRMCVCVSD